MVYLPKIIPRVPSNLSLRGFMKSDFKYSALELSGATSPTDGRGCSQRLRWKTMSMRMRILSVSLLVGICVAIQVTIILLIRRHYRKPTPMIDLPESVKYPWRSFPEENWRPIVQDRHEAVFSEPYAELKLSHTCPGPNGKTFPYQKYYTHTPASHPIPELGSYELLNLSKPCMSYNQRYDPYFDLPASTDWHWYLSQCFKTHKAVKRSVFVFRSWQGYTWHKDDILNLRAMIVELGLNTGGLYDFKILVEVKDGSAFLASEKEAERVIETVPEEFRGLVHLWSEHEMHGYYPGLSSVYGGNAIHGAYRGLFMALQKFAVDHPQYDYFYNWEMDIRYIGNYYEFFTKAIKWARHEPFDPTMRRSQKYYIPAIRNWTNPTPEDEEADLLQFGPIFDQIGSKWNFENDVVGYPNGTDTPRRAVIISASRLSRRLLLKMNHVNAVLRQAVAPEAFPSTVALHYGMKAVFVPHPVFIDKQWPPRTSPSFFAGLIEDMLDEWFNAIDLFREENMFEGISWYYRTHHAPDIYYRWRNEEKRHAADEICRWPLLLHPVKDVRDVRRPIDI